MLFLGKLIDKMLSLLFILPILCLYSELLYILNFFFFKKLRYFSFYLSLILFLFSILLLVFFDKSCFNLQFIFNLKGLIFGIDNLSLFFVILTIFIIPLCIIYS